MKLLFAGTPEAALPTLELLCASEHEIVAVLTRPDAPQGRKKILTPSPISSYALKHNIPIIYADKIDLQAQHLIEAAGADLGVVVAYGALLPSSTLDSVPYGWINLHFSSLPHWRGAAPVQWQLISGSLSAGSSVFSLVPELDAGDLYDVREYQISLDETSGDLLNRLSHEGADQILTVVTSIQNGTAKKNPQKGVATFARKLSLEDGHLKTSGTAQNIYNQFRGVTPEPGAFVIFSTNHLKIIEAHLALNVQVTPQTISFFQKKLYLGCSEGSLELKTVQPFGKQQMSAMDWFRGLRQEVVQVS